jgi:hypothetical protein
LPLTQLKLSQVKSPIGRLAASENVMSGFEQKRLNGAQDAAYST